MIARTHRHESPSKHKILPLSSKKTYFPSRAELGQQEKESCCLALESSCDLTSVFEFGCGNGDMLRFLLSKGIDAQGLDGNPSFIEESNKRLPRRARLSTDTQAKCDSTYSTVFSYEADLGSNENEVCHTIDQIARVATQHVLIKPTANSPFVQNRGWWEQKFLEAGFRRHPALMRTVGYANLETELFEPLLLLERINSKALAQYPNRILAEERDLHMDMLRESGRRSDAHLQRYEFASSFVRKGSTIVDAACGLGYGAAILNSVGKASQYIGIDNSTFAISYAKANYSSIQSSTSFRVGDAHELASVEDNSVHLIVSFETLEHLSDPSRFIESCLRRLVPGGRLIASIPNSWVDESGNDPNPHHLHIFDAQSMVGLFAEDWIVEELHSQTAGGGQKRLSNEHRNWQSVDFAEAQHTEAEWWILIATKKPHILSPPPYIEIEFDRSLYPLDFGPIAFDLEFENPWIRHAIVSPGSRIRNSSELKQLCESLLEQGPQHSNEAGAALCVLGYRDLEDEAISSQSIRERIDQIESWLDFQPGSPFQLRWTISLEFLAAELALQTGDMEEASDWYLRCSQRNATEFSPLLATKTVESAYKHGLIAARKGHLEKARESWRRGIENAEAAFHSDWMTILGNSCTPLPFSLHEMEIVADFAAKCSAGLVAAERLHEAPGLLCERLKHTALSERHRVERVKTDYQLVNALEENRARLREVKQAETDAQIWRAVAESAHSELWIWGAGRGGLSVANRIASRKGRFDGFLVSRGEQSTVAGAPIIPWPEFIKRPSDNPVFICVVSNYFHEIVPALEKYGKKRDMDYIVIDADVVIESPM